MIIKLIIKYKNEISICNIVVNRSSINIESLTRTIMFTTDIYATTVPNCIKLTSNI